MKKKKSFCGMGKMLFSLMMVMAIAVGLIGCSGGSEDTSDESEETAEESSEDTTIKIVMDNTSPEQYEELFNSIADELGIQIELLVAPGNYEQFLQTQLQSSEKPDIFKLNSQYLMSFIQDGLTTDLNPYFNGEWKEMLGDDWDVLTKGSFNQCRRVENEPMQKTEDPDAPLWAIPFDAGCQAFGINRGLMEDTPLLSEKIEELVNNGTIPCKPWEVGTEGQVEAYTYSEFSGLLAALQEVINSGELTGDAQNLKYAFQGPDSLKLLTYSAGGSFLNDSYDTVTLDNEGVVDAAFFIKDGINKGYIDPMEDGGEGWNNWVSGMYLFDANTGTWENGTYLENGMKVPMMPIPVPDDADRSAWVSCQTGSSMVLRNGSPNEEMAAKVMCKFISRSSESFQLEKAMNMPLYDDTWEEYISGNDENNGGYYPYDENCKNVYNLIISGENGQVQETYYTAGRNWWDTFSSDFSNEFCMDESIETRDDVANWLLDIQPEIQTLLESGN